MTTRSVFTIALILGLEPAPEVGADCIDYADYRPNIGSVDTPGGAQRIALSGSLAYVADSRSGLQVIDVSNPAFPIILGSVDTPGFALAVALSGTLAYVADDSSGLQIVDVSNPASPVIVGSLDTPGRAWGIAVSGTTAYVGDNAAGLQIIDVSNPAAPAILGTLDTPGYAWGVVVSGTLVYLADYFEGFTVIDVSNPASPTPLDTLPTYLPVGGVVSGTLAYLVDEAALLVVDVSNPGDISLLGSVDKPGSTFWDVTLSGELAYVAGGEGGVHAVDVSDPASPEILDSWWVPGTALGVAVSGTVAFVAAYTAGFQVIDVSNSTSPVTGTSEKLPDEIHGITVSGMVAYLAEYGAGLRLFNVSNPVTPTSLGGVNTPGHAEDVAVSGTLAYVADGEAGLQVVDVSNLAQPVIVGGVDTPGYARNVALSGTRAYVADGSTLQIIDVSNPTSPGVVGALGYNIHASDVAISGTTAYITDTYYCPDVRTCGGGGPHFPGLAVMDLNSPYATGRATPGTPTVVAVSGTFAYVADSSPALLSFDISSPLAPVLRGSIALRATASDVEISDGIAYVATNLGLEVIDVSNPAVPVLLGALSIYKAYGVAVSTMSVCLGNDNRLLTLPFQCEVTTPVRLFSFVALSQPEGILLEWTIATETDLSGFHLHRSMRSDAGYERLTKDLIRPRGDYRFLDTGVTEGVTYYYRLEALDRTGTREFLGVVSARKEPGSGMRPLLGQAFPNPVHEGTSTIPFSVGQRARVRIRVLDLAGREVRVLLDNLAEPGDQSVTWDGKNKLGEIVPAGLYLYQLTTAGFETTRKLARLR